MIKDTLKVDLGDQAGLSSRRLTSGRTAGALMVFRESVCVYRPSHVCAYAGPRSALLLGATLYCIYILSFPAALLTPDTLPALGIGVALTGGIIGGFAAGFLWSAQVLHRIG